MIYTDVIIMLLFSHRQINLLIFDYVIYVQRNSALSPIQADDHN